LTVSKSRTLEIAATWLSLAIAVYIGYLYELNVEIGIAYVTGWILFTLGIYIHYLSHKEHPKAHKEIDEIDYIAVGGVYSWVRHPGYLGLILMFYGVAIAFGSIPAMAVATLLCIYHYVLALREEQQMIKKFGELYVRYMHEVPDRMIPLRRLLKTFTRTKVESESKSSS